MEYRRPILQEMDTQEYDWVRLYIEKSPAKLFYSIAGDSAREIYLCFNKKLAPNWTLIGYQEVSTLYYLILFIPYQTPFSFIRKPKKSLFFRNTKSLHFYLS